MTGLISCAIRWDAWYGTTGNTQQAAQSLSFGGNQTKAPWFATQYEGIVISNGTQSNIDMECQLAAQAGITCFAFDQFGVASSLTAAWNLYQTSAYNTLVNWCWIGQSIHQLFGGTGAYSTACDLLASQMAQSTYQKVLTNRPLLYILWDAAGFTSYFGGNYSNLTAAISYLQTKCAALGIGNPYIVVMTGSTASAVTIASSMGANAIGTYASFAAYPSGLSYAYTALDSSIQASWVTAATAATGGSLAYVPTAMTGADARGRWYRPESWELPFKPFFGLNGNSAQGTPAQIASAIGSAVTYIGANSSVCAANALLIYAWNECSEGGYVLIPQIKDPPVNTDSAYVTWQGAHGGPAALPTSSLLAAVGSVLRGA